MAVLSRENAESPGVGEKVGQLGGCRGGEGVASVDPGQKLVFGKWHIKCQLLAFFANVFFSVVVVHFNGISQ